MKNLYKNVFFKFFLVLTFFTFSGSIFQNIFFKPILLLLFPYTFYFLYIILKNYKLHFSRSQFMYIYIMLFVFCIIIFIKLLISFGDGLGIYVQLICIFIIAFGCIMVYDGNTLLNVFCITMYLISVSSLIFYLLTNIFPNIENIFFTIPNYNGSIYKTIIMYNFFPLAKVRNCGVFWEPGIFSAYIILSLIMYNTNLNIRRIKYYNFLMIITCLTTLSIIGIVCLLLFTIWYVYSKTGNKKTLIIPLLFLSCILIFIFISSFYNFQFDYTKPEIYNIISKLNINNIIYSSRIQSVFFNINLFFDNLLIGNQYTLSISPKIVNDLSSLTYMLNLFGLVGLMYVMFFLISLVNKYHNTKNFGLLVLIIIIVFSSEPHHLFMFSWLYLFINYFCIDINN